MRIKKKLVIGFVLAVVLFMFVGMASATFCDANRNWRKQVEVGHVNASSFALVNNTFFINVSMEAAMQADGDDLLFYDSDCNELDYELEHIGDGYAQCWVRIPYHATTGTTLQLYYGNDGVGPGGDAAAAWEPAVKMVQHYEGSGTISGRVAVSAVINKYEGWPGIAKDSSGNLFVVYRTCDSDTHGFDPSGRAVIRKSTDNGNTWGPEVVIADEEGIDDRNTGILIFDDSGTETILVIYGTNTGMPPPDNGRPYCKKSTDGGQTWGSRINLTEDIGRGTWNPPILLSNGKILVPIYNTLQTTHVVESSDGGDTWTEYIAATTDGCEFSIIETKTGGNYTGGVYGIFRDNTAPAVYKKVTSTDYGHTWSAVTDEPVFDNPYMTPLTFHRAPDGKLLAAYTKDTGDLLEIYESSDEGINWTRKKTLISGASISYYPTLETIDSSKLIVCWCVNGATSDVYVNFVDYPLVDGGGDTTAEDSSGNNNNGTLMNMGWVDDGKIGKALQFDGVSGYVDCGSDASLDFGTGDFSISAWVKPNGGEATPRLLNKRYSEGWELFAGGGGNYTVRLDFSSSGIKSFNTGLSWNSSEWKHIAWVNDRDGYATFYIDGNYDSQLDISNWSTETLDDSYNLSLGGIGENYNFKGAIDEGMIYSRKLSADEINQSYQLTTNQSDWVSWGVGEYTEVEEYTVYTTEKLVETTTTSYTLLGILGIVFLAVFIISLLLAIQNSEEINFTAILIGFVTLLGFFILLYIMLPLFNSLINTMGG